MLLANNPSAVTRILPVAGGGVNQLARSFPAEFPVGVSFDEVIQPWLHL